MRPAVSSSVFLVTAISLLPSAKAQNLDEARAAWKARQSETKTGSFTFEVQRFIPAGSAKMPGRGRIALGGRGARSAEKPTGPETDVKYNATFVIKFDGAKTRAFYDAPPILLGGRLALDERTTDLTTFDGTTGMGLSTHTAEGLYPSGRILAVPESLARTTLYMPVAWHYRASETDLLLLTDDKLIDTGDTGISDGRRCLIFQEQTRRRQQFWSDPTRLYCIARYFWLLDDGTPRTTIDIEYTEDSSHGPVPTKWVVREFDTDGSLMQQEDVKVISYEINNDISAEEFRIAFPPGTYVSDQRSRERYIVRESGNNRPVTEPERRGGATYQQLLNSESGQALTKRPSGLRFVTISVTLFIILTLIALLIRQRGTVT
jgi:hypothetical protein